MMKLVKFTLICGIFLIMLSILTIYYLSKLKSLEVRPPWLFKGAYGVYVGESQFSDVPYIVFRSYTVLKIEVLDFNSTHVKLLIIYKSILPNFKEVSGKPLVRWYEFDNVYIKIPRYKLLRKYIKYEILGREIRRCIVYEYSQDGISIIYYIDKKTQFPVRIIMKYPSMKRDLKLIRSNVPSLFNP